MREYLNGNRPLHLTPKAVFVDGCFSYSHLGRVLAGLSSNQDALNRLYDIKKKEEEEGKKGLSSDFITHEEQMQEERWKMPSRMLSLVFKVPLETIDKKDVLRQFNELSQRRVNELGAIRGIQRKS